jgi:hypothetical protein
MSTQSGLRNCHQPTGEELQVVSHYSQALDMIGFQFNLVGKSAA